jgi:hypothetical protein
MNKLLNNETEESLSLKTITKIINKCGGVLSNWWCT